MVGVLIGKVSGHWNSAVWLDIVAILDEASCRVERKKIKKFEARQMNRHHVNVNISDTVSLSLPHCIHSFAAAVATLDMNTRNSEIPQGKGREESINGAHHGNSKGYIHTVQREETLAPGPRKRKHKRSQTSQKQVD